MVDFFFICSLLLCLVLLCAARSNSENARVFHTGTLSSWQLLLTASALISRPSSGSCVIEPPSSPSFSPSFTSHLQMPHLSLAGRESRPKPLEDANSLCSFLAFPSYSNSSLTAATDIHLLSQRNGYYSSTKPAWGRDWFRAIQSTCLV